jgi:hypothetical protein
MPVTLTFTTPLSTEEKLILAAIATAEEDSAVTAPTVPLVNNFPLTAGGLPDIVMPRSQARKTLKFSF